MNNIFIDIDYQQVYKDGQKIGGDVFLLDRQDKGNVITATLSDGLGSGVKANVLASLTSHMANRFAFSEMDIVEASEIIMNTLPVDQEKGFSYSTLVVARISYAEDKSFINTRLVEYDNPESFRFSGADPVVWGRTAHTLNRNGAVKNEVVYSSSFNMHVGDRLIFFSDGVPMAGIVLGSKGYTGKARDAKSRHVMDRAASDRYMPKSDVSIYAREAADSWISPYSKEGWGEENVKQFIQEILEKEPGIASRDLTRKIVTQALRYDRYHPGDDITCAAVYVRRPRRTLIITGAPRNRESDSKLGEIVRGFDGKVIVCGGTTGKIVARELGKTVKPDNRKSGGLPPTSIIEGVDLVTEGMITLSAVTDRLSHKVLLKEMPDDPAKRIIEIIRNTDQVQLVVGTKINDETDDPVMAAKIGIRIPLIERMTQALRENYLKEVEIQYL
ncbi:MAG: SpoIIE family protein phosphatase [Firmicutes bacterium]|nr:SpoIIE family protein phosphatase [Bacillota bacterium]